MTDFTKLKMAFSVGLLAVLFMLKPLFDRVAKFSYPFLGVDLTLTALYYVFAVFLGLAAYFFALELLSGKTTSPFAQRAGNTMYALAILAPPAYSAIFVIAYLGNSLSKWSEGAVSANTINAVGTGLLVLATVAALLYLRRAIGERDRSFSVRKLGDEETAQLTKTNGLLEAGLYDMVVVQAGQTIETSLRRLLLAKGVYSGRSGMKELVERAEAHGLLGAAEKQDIHDVRVLRNQVAHEAKHINRATAEQVVDAARRVVTRIGMLLSEAREEESHEERAESA
jgi:HEPN domain-containing protein